MARGSPEKTTTARARATTAGRNKVKAEVDASAKAVVEKTKQEPKANLAKFLYYFIMINKIFKENDHDD